MSPAQLCIAIIEDDPVIRESLLHYFKREDFCAEAWAVVSMEDFFEQVRSGKSANVVMTDIGLPGMSGSTVSG